jgi:hypothetical protein
MIPTWNAQNPRTPSKINPKSINIFFIIRDL